MSRLIVAWLAAATCALLAGCQGGATNVQGKVIRGDLSFILVVDSSDARLKSDGLAGTNVRIFKGAEQGGALLGEATSDPKGNFSIPIKDSAALLRQAEFRASQETYAPSSATMSIPPVSQRVLVIMKPSAASRAR